MNNYNNKMVLKAYESGYAIPAFNYSDIWELLAITEAANEEQAKVYISTNMPVVNTIGVEHCAALGKVSYEQSGRNIISHLDHSTEVELCKKAIDNGYMSVMIDASAESLEVNIDKVKKVVDYAHGKGVVVEAEVGKIRGNSEEGSFDGGEYLAEVDEAVELVNATGVDSLAVGIGNGHGFYKTKPNINIQRLKEIKEAISIPLVLHGGTGLPYDVVRECIGLGMSKVNVGTILHSTYLDELKKEIMKERSSHSIADIFVPVKSEIKKVVKEWIKVCESGNRS
ncbi:ketose-bisphosphate aldolase [Radiobacillus sp. PE A8.2]|uniref:class II fructose-bisphosphate aldolase n=1 Tax=Radiobacillus sp. PE A8.2 TaxID=3380349 RepID=UPI00388F8E58